MVDPAAKANNQAGFAFSGSKIEMLKKMGDFVLFRDGPDHVVTGGYFDNSWKLPPEAAEAMNKTGVVTVK